MNIKDKRLLWTYVDCFQPIWEVTEFHGKGAKGLYRISPRLMSICKEDSICVQKYDGYSWSYDGEASWDFVQKIVDDHRAGNRMSDLATRLTRKESKVIWS